eukprot:tig00020903_g15067.t1
MAFFSLEPNGGARGRRRRRGEEGRAGPGSPWLAPTGRGRGRGRFGRPSAELDEVGAALAKARQAVSVLERVATPCVVTTATRKAMSDALFVSERKFRVQSQDCSGWWTRERADFCVDTQLRVTDWNRAAARVTGLEPNAVLGESVLGWSRTRPEQRETRPGAGVGLGPPRGPRRRACCWAVARRDAAGAVNVVGAVAVGQDLTEKRARIEMEAVASFVPFEFDGAPCPSFVLGDPVRVKQIVMNFAYNGIKFTSRGHVLVSVVPLERLASGITLRIETTDTGLGMDEPPSDYEPSPGDRDAFGVDSAADTYSDTSDFDASDAGEGPGGWLALNSEEADAVLARAASAEAVPPSLGPLALWEEYECACDEIRADRYREIDEAAARCALAGVCRALGIPFDTTSIGWHLVVRS